MYGVAAVSRLDGHMQVSALFVATDSEKLRKGPVVLSLDPDEDDSSGLDQRSAAVHCFSADLRETTQHPRSILGIQAGVTAKAAHVLGAVYAGSAVTVLFGDEHFLLLQIVKQTDVV